MSCDLEASAQCIDRMFPMIWFKGMGEGGGETGIKRER